MILSMKKDAFGVWEVEVSDSGKIYRFDVMSEYAINYAENLMRRGMKKYALTILGKFSIAKGEMSDNE